MKVLAARAAKPQLEITALVEEFYDDVMAFCRRRVGEDRAADVTQETFLAAQRVIGKFRGQSTPRTWLLGIALNMCREASRRSGREMLFVADIPDVGSTGPDVVDRVVLEQALGKLSHEHREVVILHEMEGLTYDEIAGLLSAPVGTIKSRLHHAFVHLRRNLGVSVPA